MQKAQYLPTLGRGSQQHSALAGPSVESGLNLPSGHQEKYLSCQDHCINILFLQDPVGWGVQGSQGRHPNGDRFQTPAVPLQIINYCSFSLCSLLFPLIVLETVIDNKIEPEKGVRLLLHWLRSPQVSLQHKLNISVPQVPSLASCDALLWFCCLGQC